MTRDELNSKYPDILGKTLSECPEGWYGIIHDLCQEIDSINHLVKINDAVKFLQVKEKFFGLRVYHTLTKDDVVNRIVNSCVHEAEFKAKHTCAMCGKWLGEDEKFICEECRGGKE